MFGAFLRFSQKCSRVVRSRPKFFFGTVGFLGSSAISFLCVANADGDTGSNFTFPWLTKRWRDIKTAGLEDVELKVEKVILTPEQEKDYLEMTIRKIKEKPIPYTEEKKELILRSQLKKTYGETSLHPWYPNNREMLDAWWVTYEHNPLRFTTAHVLPPRVPFPYGKHMTLVLDARVLWGEHGRRPGVDKFLARIYAKYEIILFGTPLKEGDPLSVTNFDIDPSSMYVSYQLDPMSNPRLPFHYWKSVRCLNRPTESTIVVDVNPENTIQNPNNTVIVKEWDGKNFSDRSLDELESFLEHLAKKITTGTPVTEVCPQFHDFDRDATEIWASKKLIKKP